MIKKLKLLLQIRAWIKNPSLIFGGGIFGLGAIESWLQSDMGISIVATVANFLHVMPATLGAAALALVGLGQILTRLWTEWSVEENTTGENKP